MIGAFSGIKWIQMDLYILHRKHLEFIGQTAAKTVRVNDWSRLEDWVQSNLSITVQKR